MDESTVVFRPFNGDNDMEEGFVYSTWRNALFFDTPSNRDLPRASAEKLHGKLTHIIKNILRHPDVHVKMACLKENPIHLIGYSVMLSDHLTWVYVKVDYRDLGIGKLLTNGFKTVSSPLTKKGREIVEKKGLYVKE